MCFLASDGLTVLVLPLNFVFLFLSAGRPAFIVLEVFVTAMLILEIVIRIVVLRKVRGRACVHCECC